MTKFSIITINFNNAKGLEKTITSVVNQTFKNYEYIVIDGGSSDASKQVILQYEKQLTYWVSEPDNGIYHAMNKAIEKAKGEYLLFLNSEDLLFDNNTLAKVDNDITEEAKDLYYGNVLYVQPGKKEKTLVYPEKLNFGFFFSQTISHQGTFIKKSLFDTVGLYNEQNKIVSDWEFFILALYKHNASYKYLNYVLARYDATGISSNEANFSQVYKERDRVLNEHFKHYVADYTLFNGANNKRMKQVLHVQKYHPIAWTLIKFIAKTTLKISKH